MKKSELEAVRLLSEGETVSAARIGEGLLSRLKDGDLVIAITHGSRVSYRAVRPTSVREVFAAELAAGDLSLYETRAQLVAATGDSKATRLRSCPGFPVNCHEPIPAVLDGCELTLKPQGGSFIFICDWQNFSVPEDVVIVGVENMENFRAVGRQRYLFEHLCAPILFVSRYPQSGDLVSWLRTIPNRYVHFGDLDLAGVHIFLNEFYRIIGPRAEFFIPFDADLRLSQGSRARYDDQLHRFGPMPVSDPRVQYLVDLIHKHHKGYDQEGYVVR